jgi:hypothetical protein
VEVQVQEREAVDMVVVMWGEEATEVASEVGVPRAEASMEVVVAERVAAEREAREAWAVLMVDRSDPATKEGAVEEVAVKEAGARAVVDMGAAAMVRVAQAMEAAVPRVAVDLAVAAMVEGAAAVGEMVVVVWVEVGVAVAVVETAMVAAAGLDTEAAAAVGSRTP